MYAVIPDRTPFRAACTYEAPVTFCETHREAELIARELADDDGEMYLILKVVSDVQPRAYDACADRGVIPGVDFPATLNPGCPAHRI